MSIVNLAVKVHILFQGHYRYNPCLCLYDYCGLLVCILLCVMRNQTGEAEDPYAVNG